ncbi:MBL fold metallo-hydrolase, partial [Neptuniibacter caesariensis]
MAKILHHGAVTGVTGSCHQLFDNDDNSILIDCGLFQGAEVGSGEDKPFHIEFPLSRVSALVVTHCHIDHVGRIPYLLAAGFDKPIFVTVATAKLLPLVIEDALKVGFTKDQQLIEQVLDLLSSLIVPVEYNEWVQVPGFNAEGIRFQVAGHILGSAYVEVQLPTERVVFSGDLGAPHSPLLPSPKPPQYADTLVIESTYGDKLHESREDRANRLRGVVEHCLSNAGTVLIPAFSIGRTQELLYEIEHIIHKVGRDWENLDVVVDSPLAAKFTEHYRELKGLWDDEASERVEAGRHPLSFEQLITIDSHEDHLRLVEYLKASGRPAIVIAASGMCVGGRIVNYLKVLLDDPKTDVLFVGYQAKGTPGRDIQKYGPQGG